MEDLWCPSIVKRGDHTPGPLEYVGGNLLVFVQALLLDLSHDILIVGK